MSLPEPDQDAQAHSIKVQDYIRQKMASQGGPISFADFMQMALYAPGLGYYTVGTQKFGAGGDFVTAPEISPLFAQCLANYCAPVLAECGGDILEFGAGSGVMAADILLALEQKKSLPQHYFILEVSADLRARQQHTLRERVPHLFDRVEWLDQLPEQPMRGVVLANEVLDAMPVHKFKRHQGEIFEVGVDYVEGQWCWVLMPPSLELKKAVMALQIDVAYDYESEINLALPAWVKMVSNCLAKGRVMIIDYGFLAQEYYHPERSMGTLKCHYRHHGHDDPLQLIGLQDITAHVDFTAVGRAAEDCGLSVLQFQNQAKFLLDNGLLNLADQAPSFELNQQIKTLTMPGEMGEMFKVMVLEA